MLHDIYLLLAISAYRSIHVMTAFHIIMYALYLPEWIRKLSCAKQMPLPHAMFVCWWQHEFLVLYYILLWQNGKTRFCPQSTSALSSSHLCLQVATYIFWSCIIYSLWLHLPIKHKCPFIKLCMAVAGLWRNMLSRVLRVCPQWLETILNRIPHHAVLLYWTIWILIGLRQSHQL